jgi:VanZ family protein
MSRSIRAAAWLLTLAIVILSLVPPDLRPTTDLPHNWEHFAIFMITGVAFGLGYGPMYVTLPIGLAIFSGAIEVAQIFIPGRHSRFSDFLVDTAGLWIGLCAAWAASTGTRRLGLLFLLLAIYQPNRAQGQELKYPQIIHIHYEAKDPRVGGFFVVWVEREKISYGVDPKLPAAAYVDVTHVTPAPGTTTITVLAVTSINSSTPDYYHLSGNVRFKTSGMIVTSSNVPNETLDTSRSPAPNPNPQ